MSLIFAWGSLLNEKDPLDPSTREAVARDIARDFMTAESLCRFNETETMVWMHLGLNFGGLSISALSEVTGRDRKTIRKRVELMEKEGWIHRTGNVCRLTDDGIRERKRRFEMVWDRLPQGTKGVINREVAYRREAKPQ